MNRTVWKPYLLLLLILGMFWQIKLPAIAAFPSDLGENKKMTCYSITSENLDVYENSSLSGEGTTVDGQDLVLKATKVNRDGDALYGTYENKESGEKGEGWIAAKYFVKDPSYTSEYATIRAKMTVYTTSALSRQQATMKKYSGVITVSAKNDAYQVVYETKKGYAIGWMSAENYKNTLKYDGRDKQVLANGHYRMIPDGSDMASELKVSYDMQGSYYLEDVETGSYLVITEEFYDPAKEQIPEPEKQGFFGAVRGMIDSKYKEKMEQLEQDRLEKEERQKELTQKMEAQLIYDDTEKHIRYAIEWKDTLEDPSIVKYGTWKIRRQENHYTIRYDGLDFALGLNDQGEWIIQKTEDSDGAVPFKIRAKKKVVNKKMPFVVTQYDPKWCGSPYGSEGCIGTAGCGLLATVNAVYSLSGQYMDVFELADYAVEKHYRIIGNGTDEGIFKAAATKFGTKYGYEWDGSSYKIATLKKKLKQGDTAVAHVIGHYVAIVDYNEEKNEFLLLDSNCLPKRETTPYGDWISQRRLEEGYLYGQNYYFFKLLEE